MAKYKKAKFQVPIPTNLAKAKYEQISKDSSKLAKLSKNKLTKLSLQMAERRNKGPKTKKSPKLAFWDPDTVTTYI